MSNEMITIDQLTEILNVIPSNTYALVNENGVTKKIKLESLINKTLNEVQVLEIEGIETKDKTLKGVLTELSSQYKDIANQRVNIKTFGANGDGLNDDTQSLLDAIEYIKESGGTIYFPKGTYLIRNKIFLYSNITLLGECKNAILKANSNDYRFIIYGDNIEINNLKFDGNSENYNINKIIDCDYENKKQTKNFSLINCHIGNMKASWCHGVSLSYNENSIISNCIFDGFVSSGNGTTGDLEGSARAIVISDNTHGYVIENNLFRGLVDGEDSDFIHVKGLKQNDTEFPYTNGMFESCVGDIKNNSFYGFMKSAIKVQSQGVNITNNTIDMRELTSKKSYSSIRIQNSTNCNISNNTTILDANQSISAVYVLQRSKNIIYLDNSIIYSGNRDSTLNETERTMFIIHQCENCIVDGVNIVGKNQFNRFIWLMQPGNVIIKNINYDDSNYNITNIFYFTEKDEKAKVTIENIYIECSKTDKPFYCRDNYGGSIKIKNVEIKANSSVKADLYKQSEILNYENVDICNLKLCKNFDLNLQGCKNINIENSIVKTIQLKNSTGFNAKSINNTFTSEEANTSCYLLILDNNGNYSLLSKGNINENAKNMFVVQNDVNAFTSSENLKVKSIDDSYTDYALSNFSSFIIGIQGATPVYKSFYIKTNYTLDKITSGWQNTRYPVVLANGTIFYQNQSGNNHKMFLVSEKSGENYFVEFAIS